jgi:hypothetical protein
MKEGTMIHMSRGDVGVKVRRLEEVWKKIAEKRLSMKYILFEGSGRIVVGLEERG